MNYFIIETEDGWTIAELPAERSAEEVAAELGASVIDRGPYESYEVAADALMCLKGELEDDDFSDTPGGQVFESR